MAKLKDVLTGILKDLTQSRIAADLVSLDYLEMYRQDPLLAQMPVPRVTIKDVTLKLRFAVEDHLATPPPEPLEKSLTRLWRKELTGAVMPAILGAALREPLPAQEIRELARAAVGPAPPNGLGLGEAAAGATDRAARASVEQIMSGLRQLPEAVRSKLPPEAELRALVGRHVRGHLDTYLPRLQEHKAARQAALLDLDVIVRRADLSGVQESAVQEVTITVGMSDLETTGQPSGSPAGEG